jgi:hypothetical protein
LVGLGCGRLSQANNHRVNTSPGNCLADGAQGDLFPIATSDFTLNWDKERNEN